MGLCISTTSRLRSTKRTGQSTISGESLEKQQSSYVLSIHILDDDSLLNIFYLYRPFFLGEDDMDFHRLKGGRVPWDHGRWWIGLAHVCQRWRNLIFGSASHLGLSLVCTNGTPVENVLAHLSHLPLTVDYSSKDGITAEDEEGILLALEQRHRVRHLRLVSPVQNLQKLVMAIDEEFPILEYLIVEPPLEDNTVLMLPETLQAPNLHHLALGGFACPIRPRFHPNATSLDTLFLIIDHQSAYFQPNVLLQWISFMPQLESLAIIFSFPVPNRDVERQVTHTPITTHITLPNLRLFWFRGVSAYLEAVVCRITTPRLKRLRIQFFKQLTFSIPRLPQFMDTTENLRFDNAEIRFKDKQVHVLMFSHEADFVIGFDCWHLDWQVSSVAQISSALSQVFSAVEHLTLGHEVHSLSSEEHNDVDRTEWRNLLRSFSNVKTLRVEDGLVEELSRCLRLEDGELPLELLPELQELTYFDERATPVESLVDSGSDISNTIRRLRERWEGLRQGSQTHITPTTPVRPRTSQRTLAIDNRVADIVDRAPTPVESLFDSGSDVSNTIRRLRERWEGLRRESQTFTPTTPVRPRTTQRILAIDNRVADIVNRAPTPVESLFDSESDVSSAIIRLRDRWRRVVDDGNESDAFASFIDSRRNTGRPVTLVRRNPMADFIRAAARSETLPLPRGSTLRGLDYFLDFRASPSPTRSSISFD